MDATSYDIYTLDNVDAEKKLWNNCIFVFDTSALLDFYLLTNDGLTSLGEAFNHMGERLWLPEHVQYEFLKNRSSAIEGVLNLYEPLVKDYSVIINKIVSLKHKVNKILMHPFISKDSLNDINSTIDTINKNTTSLTKIFKEQKREKIKLIKGYQTNDPIMNLIKTYFQVGEYYNFEKILSIAAEGKLRYELRIPPGFEDYNNDKKEGTQKLGDLIIWKQILGVAKLQDSNVVLITNDIKKGDWCVLDKNKSINNPLHDLIREMYDNNGKRIWMYNLKQFINGIDDLLGIKVPSDLKFQVNQIISNKTKSIKVEFECECCDTVNEQSILEDELEYELVERHPRKLGDDCRYESEAYFYCSKCNKEIKALFNIWEYPQGSHSCSDIELDGAGLRSQDPFTRPYNEEDEILYDLYIDQMIDECRGK